MPDDTVIISNLPSHTPSGSDYLAIENDSLTGKATVNDVVSASGSVATINANVANINTRESTYLASGDFNDLTLSNGTFRPARVWQGNNVAGMANRPSGLDTADQPWSLEVVPLGSNYYSRQTLYIFRSGGLVNSYPTVYTRYQTYTSGITWTDWRPSDAGLLNNELATKALTFTLQNQSSATNNLIVRQSGHTVTVFGWVGGLTLTANTSTTIGTISGGLLPAAPVRGLCSVGSAAYTAGTLSYVIIDTSGNIAITTSNGGSGKAVYFNLTYIR